MVLDGGADLKEWKHDTLKALKQRLDRMQRREFLGAGLGFLAFSLLGGRRAWAGGDESKAVKTGTFYFPRLVFHVKDETGDQWDTLLVGDVILRKRLGELTNINISNDPVTVRLDDMQDMVRYPFVFATSEGFFDLPAAEERNLKEFLLRGGFVHADDCVFQNQDRFFKDYVKMINKLFPDTPMKRVPNDHELYHCYFDFPNGCPHMQGIDHGGYGLFEKDTGRIMSYATPGDIHCGWTCTYFKPEQNEAALKMGINIVIYYLTH
jgi:hypothetical protein